jgi:hypothetical protein
VAIDRQAATENRALLKLSIPLTRRTRPHKPPLVRCCCLMPSDSGEQTKRMGESANAIARHRILAARPIIGQITAAKGTEYTNRCQRAAKSLQSLQTNNPTGELGHNCGHKHEPATHRGPRRIERGSNQPAKYRAAKVTMRSCPNFTHEVRHRRMPCQGFGGLRI